MNTTAKRVIITATLAATTSTSAALVPTASSASTVQPTVAASSSTAHPRLHMMSHLLAPASSRPRLHCL